MKFFDHSQERKSPMSPFSKGGSLIPGGRDSEYGCFSERRDIEGGVNYSERRFGNGECPADWVEVYFDLVGETEKAIRVSDGVSTIWLPKSQIRVEKRKDGVVVWMPEWLAKEKEII